MGGKSDSILRGSRLGNAAGRSHEDGRFVEPAARFDHEFFCPKGHSFAVTFAAEAEVPATWDCPQCGAASTHTPDGDVPANLPLPPVTQSGKTHWEQLIGRRTEAELEALLAKALSNYRRTGRSFTAGQD